MLSLPQLLIAIGIVAACSSSKNGCCSGRPVQPGLPIVIAVIVVFTWPYIARIVRGYTLSLREKEFVEASRSLGASNAGSSVREILPNLIGPIIVYTTLLIPHEHPVRGSAVVPRARRARDDIVLGSALPMRQRSTTSPGG